MKCRIIALLYLDTCLFTRTIYSLSTSGETPAVQLAPVEGRVYTQTGVRLDKPMPLVFTHYLLELVVFFEI